MVPAWLAVVLAVLGIALGVFGSQATLGKQIATLIAEVKDLARRVGNLEESPPTVVHYHRRAGDALEDAE